MSSRRGGSCRTGKRRYRDEEEAKRGRRNVRGALATGGLRDTGKVPVRAYECDDCGGWHLTSRVTWDEDR